MKKIILVITALLFSMPLYAKKTELKLNLAAGQQYSSEITSEMEMTMQEIAAGTMKVIMNGTMIFSVVEKNDDHYVLDAFYTELAMGMEIMGSLQVYSSAGDQANLNNRVLKSITSRTFRVVMSDKYKVLQVSGYDKLLDGIAEALADQNLSPDAIEGMKEQFRQTFNSQSFNSNVAGYAAQFPARKIKPGDSWTDETILSTAGIEMKESTKYKFEEEKDGLWFISSNSIISTPDSVLEQEGTKVDITGMGDGQMKFDSKTGWIYQSVTEHNINMQTHNPRGSANELTMHLTITTQVKSKPVVSPDAAVGNVVSTLDK